MKQSKAVLGLKILVEVSRGCVCTLARVYAYRPFTGLHRPLPSWSSHSADPSTYLQSPNSYPQSPSSSSMLGWNGKNPSPVPQGQVSSPFVVPLLWTMESSFHCTKQTMSHFQQSVIWNNRVLIRIYVFKAPQSSWLSP